MNKTKIEWCTATLNPVVGCSFGCPYCYAERINRRFHYVEDFTRPEFFPDRLQQLRTRSPQNIFLTSMSDPADWRPEWIIQVLDAIEANPQHRYLFLSKRPEAYTSLFPLPVGQLEFVRREIYDYFGVNEDIVQNKADAEKMDAFYRGQLAPFYAQLAQGLTNALFTEREQAHGNAILCELDRIQFETLDKRVEAAQFLTNIGALELDQVLGIFGFPPIGGEEGKRRVQTLNMANAEIVDKYQLTSAGSKDDPPKEDNPQTEEHEENPEQDEEQEEKDNAD